MSGGGHEIPASTYQGKEDLVIAVLASYYPLKCALGVFVVDGSGGVS